MKYEPLIFGKNFLERIVSIEPHDRITEVFMENAEGKVMNHFIPNKYWILANRKLDQFFKKMNGDLFYQYGKQYNDRTEFMADRNRYKHSDIYSIWNPKEAAMVKDGLTYFKGMQHNEVSILAFDIESTGLFHDKNSKVLLIANTFRRNGVITRKQFAYDDYANEGDMLVAWCEWVREIDPSIMCGHNIFCYDLPYLKYCADMNNVQLELGRNGTKITFERYESKFRKDSAMFYHYNKAHIYGREIVDTMFTAIRYDIGRKHETYSLKPFIKAEGLEVEGRVFYDAGTIRNNYKIPSEWKKIKAYAEHDGDDALAVYDLTTPPFFYLTQAVPKPYQLMLTSASGSQINSVMARSYLQEAHSLPKADETNHFEGAISIGNPGIYRNVFKVDVASLYPSIMIQYNIFDKNKDPLQNFSRLVNTFTERRLKNKKLAKETKEKYYDDLQNAEKIFINSCYGFLGTNGLLFNYPEGAAEVTRKGREILQKSIDWSREKGFTLVNADTDSISITRRGDSLTLEERQELLSDLNAHFPEKIKFEDDGYFSSLIVVRAKNYILHDPTAPKKKDQLKIKGSALKASTKEPALKEFIKSLINTIITREFDYENIYQLYVKEILEIKDMKRWATRKTITQNVLKAKRTNEQKVLDAIKGTEYVEGDRCHMFFKNDNTLCLIEEFDGDYNKDVLLAKLHETAQIFDTVLPTKQLFPNFKLKKNKVTLNQLYPELYEQSKTS